MSRRLRLTARAARMLPALLAPLVLVACETVPGTGRSQLNFVPDSMATELGMQGYQQTLSESKVISSGPEADLVARVGKRISEAALRMYPEQSSDFDWQIVLIDEPQTVNAWCMPGGKMAVYTGLLPVTQDEDSLGVVVGHEVAHAVARHGSERMSQVLLLDLGLTAASASMSDMDAGDRDLVMAGLVGIGTLGAIMPYSRVHETEADELGLYLAADAGYDPQAAIGLWQRMAASNTGSKPIEFLSSHPSDETRIAHLEQVMPQAMEYYKAAQKSGR